MAARAIWKGSISFGLVNIPIQVFSATQKEDYTSFSQLRDKGHKIKYKKSFPVEEREVPWSEIKKGYEITKNIEAKSKGQEIVPKQEEEPEETRDIIEALKASVQVKGKSSKSTAAKAKGKIAIGVSR